MTKRIMLRVKPGTPLPHDVYLRSEAAKNKKVLHQFNPDCEVDEAEGMRMIAAYPNTYEIAEGTADKSKYPVRETTKQQLFAEVFKKLTQEGQLRVFEFARKVENDTADGADDSADIAAELAEAKERIEELEKKVRELSAGVQYEKWTADALKEEAKEREIEGYAQMNKEELVKVLKK